jgi:hypothetical protein
MLDGDWSSDVCSSDLQRNIHIIRYEELREVTQVAISCLIDFMGVDFGPSDLAEVIDRWSFSRMSEGRSPGEEDKESHIRKGISGDWKNHFSPLVKALFMKMSGNFLIETGYELNSDW